MRPDPVAGVLPRGPLPPRRLQVLVPLREVKLGTPRPFSLAGLEARVFSLLLGQQRVVDEAPGPAQSDELPLLRPVGVQAVAGGPMHDT